MKYRIFIAITVLTAILCFCVTAYAANYEYAISPNDNFIAAKHGEDVTTVAQKLDMTTSELNTYINENGIIYLAVSNDKKSQIKISAFTDNFSSEIGDISRLDDKALLEFANTIGQDAGVSADIVSNNDREYVRIVHTRKDSGGIYTITQYITICNNKTFHFVGYNDGETTSDEISSAFKTFSLTETIDVTANYSWYIVLIIAGVVVFSALAIIMIIQIVQTHTKAKIDTKTQQNLGETYEN